jgi:hypothetical protein
MGDWRLVNSSSPKCDTILGREFESGATLFIGQCKNKRRNAMARYGKAAGKSMESAMHREKRGTLRSGKGGKGGKVTSRKQAIAIGLSEARKKGAKVPKKKS